MFLKTDANTNIDMNHVFICFKDLYPTVVPPEGAQLFIKKDCTYNPYGEYKGVDEYGMVIVDKPGFKSVPNVYQDILYVRVPVNAIKIDEATAWKK